MSIDSPVTEDSAASSATGKHELDAALQEALKKAYKEASEIVEAAEVERIAKEAAAEAALKASEGQSEDTASNDVTDGGNSTTTAAPTAARSYVLTAELEEKVRTLARTKHAARGILLTLALYKMLVPKQDIRMNKSEHPNGFSARVIDTKITVPFLLVESLPKNVESHWLTQSFSFAEPWTRERKITTKPPIAGRLLVDVVNDLQDIDLEQAPSAANDFVVIVLEELIRERNRGRVDLTRPKNLTIDETRRLLTEQFARHYRSGGPRLPQLAIYAAYSCLFDTGVGRYNDWKLAPLGRMKAADRKSGTVGDIVVIDKNRPVEAVETKLGVPINRVMVLEAMQKIATASVERYLILSTAGIDEADRAQIQQHCVAFKQSNGCEVIVNGVLDTIGYYLRLLPSTLTFLDTYAALMEIDKDIDYEHKVAWNEICAKRNMV